MKINFTPSIVRALELESKSSVSSRSVSRGSLGNNSAAHASDEAITSIQALAESLRSENPVFDNEQVARLRQEIEAGHYRIDSFSIAQGFLEDVDWPSSSDQA